MRTIRRGLVLLLAGALGAPPWALAAIAPAGAETARRDALSSTEMAAAVGGVAGGKVGYSTGGHIQLTCAPSDAYLGNDNWVRGALTPGPCGTKQSVPFYSSKNGIFAYVNGTVTSTSSGINSLQVYLNGTSIASIPCGPNPDAAEADAGPYHLFSYVCPPTVPFQSYQITEVPLPSGLMETGLNIVGVQAGNQLPDTYGDSEFRVFYTLN
jgi:hypothetical protein